MRKAQCKFENLVLEKNVRHVEPQVNTLSKASEELHCLSEDLIAKKMVHGKIIKYLEDHQFVLENKLQKNLGSCQDSPEMGVKDLCDSKENSKDILVSSI